MADADDRLRAVWRTEPPPAVLALADTERTGLADLLDDARRRRARSLQDAFEASLKHVQLEHLTGPRLTRIARLFSLADDTVRSGLREAAADGRFDAAAPALIDR